MDYDGYDGEMDGWFGDHDLAHQHVEEIIYLYEPPFTTVCRAQRTPPTRRVQEQYSYTIGGYRDRIAQKQRQLGRLNADIEAIRRKLDKPDLAPETADRLRRLLSDKLEPEAQTLRAEVGALQIILSDMEERNKRINNIVITVVASVMAITWIILLLTV